MATNNTCINNTSCHKYLVHSLGYIFNNIDKDYSWYIDQTNWFDDVFEF